MVKVEIPMKLPSLNEYINACRGNRFAGANMKKQVENDIGYFINRLPKFEKPIKIKFIWVEKNEKRDLDNICYRKEIHIRSSCKSREAKKR